MKLLNIGDIKKIDYKAINKNDTEKKAGWQRFMGKLGELVEKATDCYIE